MTEPHEIAEEVEQTADGLYHWRIHNANIGGAISSSHALVDGAGCVFVDPVRLADYTLAALPTPSDVVLTARCHQRAAWRYRRELGAQVWLPADATPAEEEPDRRYGEGDTLPGGLVAVHTPGPEWPHYSFLRAADPAVLFCSDLISHAGGGEVRFISPAFHEDPAETRRSVERLLELPFAVLCFAHGAPLLNDPKASLRKLLAS